MKVYDMSAKPPKIVEIDLIDWEQNGTADAATGYIKISGHLYSSIIRCASCAKDIPYPPISVKPEDYKCPECGRRFGRHDWSKEHLPF